MVVVLFNPPLTSRKRFGENHFLSSTTFLLLLTLTVLHWDKAKHKQFNANERKTQKNRQTVARGTNGLKQNKILIYNKEREKDINEHSDVKWK